MHPVLVQIPALPVAAWLAVLFAFFALSAYWGVRDIAAEGLPAEEARRRSRSTVLTNAALFLLVAALLWRFREAVHHALPVRAYGFLLMIAFAAGTVVLARLTRGSVMRPENVTDLMLGVLLSSIICARILFVAMHWSDVQDWRELLRVWEGGLSFHGGLAGGAGWVLFYVWRQRVRFLWLADVLSPCLALGYAIARIGCFLNGCCYGTPTNLPWAVRFQDPPLTGKWTPPSHPVQIYALLANLAICAILLRVLRRKQFDGQVFGMYLILYSTYRFAAEVLRKGATGEVFGLGFTQAQWASVAIIVVGAALMAVQRRKGKGLSPDGAAAGATPPAEAQPAGHTQPPPATARPAGHTQPAPATARPAGHAKPAPAGKSGTAKAARPAGKPPRGKRR